MNKCKGSTPGSSRLFSLDAAPNRYPTNVCDNFRHCDYTHSLKAAVRRLFLPFKRKCLRLQCSIVFLVLASDYPILCEALRFEKSANMTWMSLNLGVTTFFSTRNLHSLDLKRICSMYQLHLLVDLPPLLHGTANTAIPTPLLIQDLNRSLQGHRLRSHLP